MRDFEGDYKRALLEEYAAYQRAGRTADANAVAQHLRQHYGHEVEPKPAPAKATAKAEAAPETTAAPPPEEDTAEPKPARGRGRPKLPRDGKGNIVRDSGKQD